MSALDFDSDGLLEFLTRLLAIPSPTGFTADAIQACREAFAPLGDLEIGLTRKGALKIRIPGAASARPIGLTAHVDTLGLMVRSVLPNGRLRAARIGGLLLGGAESENVTVRTSAGRLIRGTFALSNTSTHVNSDAGTTQRTQDTMEIRLDAPVSSAADVLALGVGTGDFVFLDPRIEVTDTGFVKSRFLDNKAGVVCIWAALKALRAAHLMPPQDVYILIANFEEVGHGGSADWPANLEELLCVDMGALGDGLTGDEFSVSICAKDSSGPYSFEMITKLRAIAEAAAIPYHVDLYPNYSSDGSAYWRAGGSARVGLAGPGIAFSHSYERTHVDSLLHASHLFARYILAE